MSGSVFSIGPAALIACSNMCCLSSSIGQERAFVRRRQAENREHEGETGERNALG